MPKTTPLHVQLEHLGFLIGTWRGTGAGEYPTIESFQYNEEVTFSHVGKPFIAYIQKTSDKTTGLPLHSESGYLRPVGSTGIELVLAQPSGIVEMHHGKVSGQTLKFHTTDVFGTKSAKEVTEVHRDISVEAGTLSYTVSMAAVGQPLQHHLRASLASQS